jgi:hypothetical protein
MWLDRYDDLSPWTLNIYYHAVADDPSAATALDETTSVRWFTPAELADADTHLAFPDHMRPAVDLWLASPTPDPDPDGARRR